MAASPSYNLSMVFERTSNWDFAEVTMTYRMLRILALTDGEACVAEICQTLDLTYDALFSDLQKLHEMHLVTIQAPAAPKKKAPARIKKGVFRGAAFEVSVDPHDADAPVDTQQMPPVKAVKGVFRGAAFDVTVDEGHHVTPASANS